MKWKVNYAYYGLCILTTLLLVWAAFCERREPETAKQKETSSASDAKSRKKSEEEDSEALNNPVIRVLLRGNGFVDEVHPEVSVQAQGAIVITCEGEVMETQPGEVFTAAPDHPLLTKGSIRLAPKEAGDRLCVLSLERGAGNPSYRGTLELIPTAEGVVLVNELSLEEYLCGVVPSEMPASYEAEALKCQAVCARSYACSQIVQMSYPEYHAHIDDSTKFQVYGNSGEDGRTNAAVEETKGKRLLYNGQVAAAYYYSTSCGRTTDMSAWGGEVNEANAYLTSVSVAGEQGDYEKELPWYRWDASISGQDLAEAAGLYTKTQLGQYVRLEVTKRGAGGIAQQITVTGTAGSVTVETENKIRQALGGSRFSITKADGTTTPGKKLLPSAFFTVEENGGTVVLHGGGFGHGIGMSQNGANEMAKQGMGFEEILSRFYPGTTVG